MDKLSWTLYEYEEKEKNNDWFWALALIIIAGSITAFLYKNYFFSALILIGGVLFGYFANKKPELVTYELNKDGFQIKNHLFPYKTIKAFWVKEESKPELFIRTERYLFPVVSVPIEINHIEIIKDILTGQEIKEEEIKETIADKIMEYIDF